MWIRDRLNASPFHLDKSGDREERMAERARRTGLPLLYAHLVGGQDEVVFDGASFAVDARGEIGARAPAFADDLLMVELDGHGGVRGPMAATPTLEAQAWSCLLYTSRCV